MLPRVLSAYSVTRRAGHPMFYVLDSSPKSAQESISIGRLSGVHANLSRDDMNVSTQESPDRTDYAFGDIDVVDDALLNTAPHNPIERQLLTGDMVGLALMSGAIIWSAMGAFG